MKRIALALGLLLVGCGGTPPKPRCTSGFVGDRGSAMAATLVVSDGTSGQLVDVAAGADVPLEPPPQGGYVIYAGVRARNLDTCGVTLRGQLRDADSGRVLAFDGRQTDLVVDGSGWAAPAPSDNANLANVNPCPDNGDVDVQGHPLLLEVNVVDRAKRSLTVSVPVVPRCDLADPAQRANCVCTCSAHYFLGKCGFGDGGVSDAGADAASGG